MSVTKPAPQPLAKDEQKASKQQTGAAAGAAGTGAGVATSTNTSAWVNGLWKYRSYLNDAAQSLFGEGDMQLSANDQDQSVTGTLNMDGLMMDLKGTALDAYTSIHLKGFGRDGTPTAGWKYDYQFALAYRWPNGVNQVPSFVGSVIRVVPHGKAAAGVVASAIAVRVASGSAPATGAAAAAASKE